MLEFDLQEKLATVVVVSQHISSWGTLGDWVVYLMKEIRNMEDKIRDMPVKKCVVWCTVVLDE